MLPKHVRYQAALHPARPGCRHRRWFCSRRRNISYYTCVHLSTPFFNFSEKTSLPFLPPSQRSLAPLCKGSCPASSRTEGLPHGEGARGRAKPFSNLRTEPALQAAPVFRSAYFPYLTAFRMQAKQIQRLPLRGAGAKRLKGGPWG